MITDNTGGDPIKLHLSQSKTNVSGILQEKGNFVLREVTSSGCAGHILWQSFDSPTSAFLPGMKLGINHKTGQNWSLTSWFSKVTPNPGAFTLEWVPSEHQLIIKRRGVRFWSSGILENGKFKNVDVSEMYLLSILQNIQTKTRNVLRTSLLVFGDLTLILRTQQMFRCCPWNMMEL
ncbi:hypothetical protein Q3G72_006023 [Acer saccharum]|nr:hypothetical protein Q3G72_006023 [Acer saccharum]